jgi:hypothetical protein
VPQETRRVRKYDPELGKWVRVRAPLTGICKPCQDELYAQLAAEYGGAPVLGFMTRPLRDGDPQAVTRAMRQAQARLDAVLGTSPQTRQQTADALIAKHLPGLRRQATEYLHAKGEESMTDTIETAEVVETTGEIVPYEPPATALTIYGTSDPAVALQQIATTSGLFVDVARNRDLVDKIRGKEYMTAGGYDLLAGLTGLAPYVAWAHETEDGYHVRVEVRRVVNGTAIAAAEQICSRSEPKWARAEKHALLGMAQTRARRRALASVLAPIVELAGYQSGDPPADAEPEPRASEPVVPAPSREQMARIGELIASLAEAHPDVDWKQKAREVAGVSGDMLTRTVADELIDRLEQELGERT